MSKDTTTKKYFKFPLCLLSYDPPRAHELEDIIYERFQSIANYCVVETGTKAADEDDEDEQDEEDIIALGARVLGVNVHSPDRVAYLASKANEFICHYHNRFGADYSAVIRTDIFWDAVAGQIDYRRFTVLCAALTMIGNKPYAQLTRSVIRHRELGHIKADSLKAVGKRRNDKLKELTDDKIRYALDQLENAGLIVRVWLSPRRVIASNKLTYKELVEMAEIKKKAQMRVPARRESERQIMADLSPL
jgi:hypothetical protein